MNETWPPVFNAVYVFYNPETKQAYVGSTKDAFYRKRKHLEKIKSKSHPNYKFQRAYDKNPNFIFIYIKMETREDALEAEQKLIDEFYGQEFFLNISNDARYCCVWHSPESRIKISTALKGRIVSPETREKLRIAHLGKSKKLGFRHTEESKKKMSIASTGRTHSVSLESREIMRQKKLGTRLSEDHKKKLSQVATGRKDPPKTIMNKHLGNLYRSRKIIIDGIRYESLAMASKAIGLTKTTIANRINRGIYEEAK